MNQYSQNGVGEEMESNTSYPRASQPMRFIPDRFFCALSSFEICFVGHPSTKARSIQRVYSSLPVVARSLAHFDSQGLDITPSLPRSLVTTSTPLRRLKVVQSFSVYHRGDCRRTRRSNFHRSLLCMRGGRSVCGDTVSGSRKLRNLTLQSQFGWLCSSTNESY